MGKGIVPILKHLLVHTLKAVRKVKGMGMRMGTVPIPVPILTI